MLLGARRQCMRGTPTAARLILDSSCLHPQSRPCSSKGTGGAGTATFGHKTVRHEEKEGMVGDVFRSVAAKYDLMNDAMSFGVHRLWKSHFVGQVDPLPGYQCLDVAGGTGDIAFRLVDRIRGELARPPYGGGGFGTLGDAAPRSTIWVTDINPAMLEEGKRRAVALFGKEMVSSEEEGGEVQVQNVHPLIDLKWRTLNAESLPMGDNSLDVYTISFGLRNVTDIPKALREARRVLKPGGRFFCLEFSKVDPLVEPLYKKYTMDVVPAMGQLLASDWDSYRYLSESIDVFHSQESLVGLMKEAGFVNPRFENLTFGTVAIHTGVKA